MKYDIFDLSSSVDTPMATVYLSKRGRVTCDNRLFDKVLDTVYVNGCDRSDGNKFLEALPDYFSGSMIAVRIAP